MYDEGLKESKTDGEEENKYTVSSVKEIKKVAISKQDDKYLDFDYSTA